MTDEQYDAWVQAEWERTEREDRAAMEAAGETEEDVLRALEEGLTVPRPLTVFQQYVNDFSGSDPRPLATFADLDYWEAEIRTNAWIIFRIDADTWNGLTQTDRDVYILKMMMGKKAKPEVAAPPAAESAKKDATESKPKLSLDEQALAVFFKDQTLSKAAIARRLGKEPPSLCPERCPKLDAAMRAYKAKIDPSRRMNRGKKDANGTVEAWDGAG
jgi:hypothetical protein